MYQGRRDDLFCAFFRLPSMFVQSLDPAATSPTASITSPRSASSKGGDGGGSAVYLPSWSKLDVVSLLACHRQGIEPQDLLYTPDNEALSEERRKAKIRLLEQERHVISLEVTTRGASAEGAKARSRLALGQELQALIRRIGDGRITHDPLLGLTIEEERYGVLEIVKQFNDASDQKTLALSRSRGVIAFTPHGEKFGQGEDEVEKLRRRQMRFVAKEFQKEIEGQQLNAKMVDDEERRRQWLERRRQEIQSDALAQQEERSHRLESVKEKSELRYLQMKDRAQEYDKRAAERERKRQQLLKERAAEQRAKSEQRLALVRERALIVQQDAEVRAELLQHEMEQKHVLHEERKLNLQLRRDTQRELARIKELHHTIALKEWSEKQGVLQEMQQVELHRKYVEQDVRVTTLVEHAKQHSEVIHNDVEEKQRIAQEKRNEVVLQRLERRHARLQRSLQREEDLQHVHSQDSLQRKAYYYRNEQRRRNNEDNRKRLARLAEYKIALQEEKLRQNDERVRQIEQAKQRSHVARQVERQRMADQKQVLMDAVMQLRLSNVMRVGSNNNSNRSVSPPDDVETFMKLQLESMEAAQRRTPRAHVPRNVFSQISWHNNSNKSNNNNNSMKSNTGGGGGILKREEDDTSPEEADDPQQQHLSPPPANRRTTAVMKDSNTHNNNNKEEEEDSGNRCVSAPPTMTSGVNNNNNNNNNN
eukprot:PhM_4_TR1317/c3_g1_i1/m.52844